jgi:DNA-binding transcriptional LysR family regulator
MDPLAPLRVGDLLTLLVAQRVGSLAGAARELQTTTSQVSKAIARLEEQFGAPLLIRESRGIVLTPVGKSLMPRITRAVAELRAGRERDEDEREVVPLTVAGPSYLLSALVGPLAAAHESLHVRGLEMAPALIRARLAENLFDIAFALGGVASAPSTWTSTLIGTLRFALFGSPATAKALGPAKITVDVVRKLSFVCPMSHVGDQLVAIGDNCPLPTTERHAGHEAHTIAIALELAAETPNVVFGPVVAARRLVEIGNVVEIPVDGWDVHEPVFILCNGDRVKASVQRAIVASTRERLSAW